MTATELRQRLDKGELSSRELTEAILDRIDELEPSVGAFVTVTREEALAAADAADKALAEARAEGRIGKGASGKGGAGSGAASSGVHPLLGIPGSVKDNIATAGVKTTASSKVLAQWVPPYDAAVVAALKEAGAPVVGKTNMDEFAMGSTTQYSQVKKTHNPWHLDRTPGGSSGGGAASVAAGMAVWGLGTDTGGSIRQPAANCGIVGMKPTYGLVSRFGAIAMASSLDQVGPFTRDVADMAILLNAVSAPDPRDTTSAPGPRPDFTAALRPEAKGLRIGLPKEFYGDGIAPDVRAAVEKAARQLEEAGAELVELSLPHAKYALPAYSIIVPAEASSALARIDGVRYGLRAEAGDVNRMMTDTRAQFGLEVKRRILLGTFVRGRREYEHYYVQALKVRAVIQEEFTKAFAGVDVMLTPAAPTTALPLGDLPSDPVREYSADLCTVPVNLAGLPALSMPCGVDEEGLPIGLQLIGPAFGDEAVLQAAYTYEQLAWPKGAGRQWRGDKEVAVHGR